MGTTPTVILTNILIKIEVLDLAAKKTASIHKRRK